jgi:hypothetical protein
LAAVVADSTYNLMIFVYVKGLGSVCATGYQYVVKNI